MKIIRDGIIPGDKHHEGTCNRCGCLFDFAESEAKHHQGWGTNAPHNISYMTIQCPTCNYGVQVEGGYFRAKEISNG